MVSRETPPAPAVAAGLFGTELRRAERYAALLAGPGIERGLLGPRELPRLWDRHLLNCAVLADEIGESRSVADVGSGAGLPGVVLALRRRDLRVALVEPLLRRTTFLEEVVDDLGLDNVDVVRARAEELHGTRAFDVVTSRAVAPLAKLLRWCLPLAASGGEVLAMKGSSVAEELDAAEAVVRRAGAGRPEIVHIGSEWLSFPSTAVRVRVGGSRR